MLVTRSAIVLLVGCIFLSPATHVSPSSKPVANHTVDRMVCHSGASDHGQLIIRASGPMTPLRFTRWRPRPKIVLGETDQKVVDESDLGHVLIPSPHTCSGPTPSISPYLPVILPLRC
jgi:hypothetical protein